MRRINLSLPNLPKKRLFALAGVALIVFSALAGLPINNWLTAKKYQLNGETMKVIGKAKPELAKKLVFNSKDNVYQFNAEAKKTDSDKPEDVAKRLQQNVTGDTTNKGLYSLDLSVDSKQGMTIYDNNSRLSFKLIPKFEQGEGRKVQGRLVYPMPDGAKAIYTVKSNGIKEDIVFEQAPRSGEASFSYDMVLPESLEARLLDDNSLGVYSADPALFGDISFGGDEDKEKVESARKNAPKDNLVFSVPRPVIVAANGDTASSYASFSLDGSVLTVNGHELQTIQGAFSIDPSVIVTSSSDFATGNDEGGVEFGTDEIKRGGLSGGTTGAYASTTSLLAARQEHTTIAYNGYIYVIGGNINGTLLNSAEYALICNGSNNGVAGCTATPGTLGTWSATSSFTTARRAHSSVVYNGYVYVIGGFGGNELADVQYALICTGSNSGIGGCSGTAGALGTWAATTNFITARSSQVSIAYNGYVYIIGGGNGTNLATVEYSPFNSDGTVGSWAATTSFTTGRRDFTGTVYNGYVYIMGGLAASYLSDVQYAPINSNGTLGAWVTTTSFTTARAGLRANVNNGYLYLLGGTNGTVMSDVQHAPINADGSVGTWIASTSFTTARFTHSTSVYNGYVYVIGGKSNVSIADVQYAKISTPGVTTSYTVTTPLATTGGGPSNAGERAGHSTVINNGFMYVIGGSMGQGIYKNNVHYAPINPNGTIGAWTITTSFTTARSDHSSVVYNGYLYLLGGYDGVTTFSDVQYAPINTNGSIGTWATTTSLTVPRLGLTAHVYNGFLYIVGGSGQADVQYALICTGSNSGTGGCTATAGTVGTWTATSTFTTGRKYHSSIISNGYLYVIGGNSSLGNLSDVQYAPINTNGTLGAFTATTSFTTARTSHTSVVYNGYVYVIGGNTAGGFDTRVDTVQYAPINNDGTVGTWVATSSFNLERESHTSVVYNGFLYVIGGVSASSFQKDVRFSRINNGGPGATGAFAATTSFTTARFQHTSVVANGYLYVMGGSNGSVLGDVQYALINANGTLGPWATTTSLPSARSGHGSAVANGYLYVIGGYNGTVALADVQYALICTGSNSGTGGCTGTAGTVGTWTATTSFTTARDDHAVVVAKGYLYISGGFGGSRLNDVQYALICTGSNSGTGGCTGTAGTVGTWTATTSFTTARNGHASIASNGYLYIVGGFGGSYLADVQYALICTGSNSGTGGCGATAGTVGTWTATTNFGIPRDGHTLTVLNGYLYIIGGNAGVRQNDVQYASINSGGSVGEWTTTTSFTTARSDHTTVNFNGNLYVAGGQNTSDASVSDVQYASLNSIPRMARYSKQVDLGSTAVLTNISYTGTLPGGKDNISFKVAGTDGIFGTSISSSTLSGICATGVSARYVLIMATFDDSLAGIFTDNLSAISSVQDLTVDYLAVSGRVDPSLRLRAGKSFKAEIIQPLDIVKSVADGC